MLTDARLAYVENEILQADPLQLVQMLYRGALQAVIKARQFLHAGDITARSRQVTKASEIINELTLSLDHERGGDIARNLVELYDYMQRLLQDANFRQVEPPLVELESLLGTLLEAWEQCDPSAAPAPTPSARPAVAMPPPSALASAIAPPEEALLLYGPPRYR
ncbi:MAG: flagellar export chaperone FliS [Bryobacterales bacterium]|nr:flagellar export chaperone FliS [Bryobacterales bacterium]